MHLIFLRGANDVSHSNLSLTHTHTRLETKLTSPTQRDRTSTECWVPGRRLCTLAPGPVDHKTTHDDPVPTHSYRTHVYTTARMNLILIGQ